MDALVTLGQSELGNVTIGLLFLCKLLFREASISEGFGKALWRVACNLLGAGRQTAMQYITGRRGSWGSGVGLQVKPRRSRALLGNTIQCCG